MGLREPPVGAISETTASLNLKLDTVSSFSPFILISLWMPLVQFSLLRAGLYIKHCAGVAGTRASSLCCSSAKASIWQTADW